MKKLTNEEFIQKAQKVHGYRYIYTDGTYTSSNQPIKVVCPTHGLFNQIAGDHLRGFGCSACSGKKRLTTEQFIEKAKKVHFDKYDYTKTVYISSNKELCITCPKHGDFLKKPNHHLYGTQNGCPRCSYSKGELFTENWLIQHSIVYEKQKKFDGCINPTTNYRLRFDFYIPSLNMCIEVDGIQHTTERHYLNGIVKNFTGTKDRDEIKNDYCSESGIKLVRLQWIKKTEDLEKQLNKLFYETN